ncbi:hypothetical protein, partial [Pseudomonas aeruginosa]|uniref:hypothetical protein n=1 Tax=Pseudomonas aeruginosa TaxID=287 RepID=UPI002B40F684
SARASDDGFDRDKERLARISHGARVGQAGIPRPTGHLRFCADDVPSTGSALMRFPFALERIEDARARHEHGDRRQAE